MLGASGAALFQKLMTTKTVELCYSLKETLHLEIVIAFDGASFAEMRSWLGTDFTFIEQPHGDLGCRMQSVFEDTFAGGAESVVIIGTDIPGLNSQILEEALNALRTTEAVLGPTQDGGYYLVGLRKSNPEIFVNIPWGSSNVFHITFAKLANLNLPVHVLKILKDIDSPNDLQCLSFPINQ